MWESKGWVVFERVMGWITVLVLAFAVWNTLLRVETNQAKQHKQVNETLEAIRERVSSKTWQQIEPSLRKSK